MSDVIARAREVVAAATPEATAVLDDLAERIRRLDAEDRLAHAALPALLDVVEAAERVDCAYCDRALCEAPCAHRWCELRRTLDRALAALREAL